MSMLDKREKLEKQICRYLKEAVFVENPEEFPQTYSRLYLTANYRESVWFKRI